MTADFDTFWIRSDADWPGALQAVAVSRRDVLLVNAAVDDVTQVGRALQAHASSDAKLAIVGATTLKPFQIFNRPEWRIYSAGRRILSPLGVVAERANRLYGELPSVLEWGPKLTLVESLWGSAVYIKRSFLDLVGGLDATFVVSDKPCVLNFLIDDLCLRALLEDLEVGCASDVTARVEDEAIRHPLENISAYQHWKQKWGWDAVVPNIYQLRARWQGTVLARSMLEDLLEPWAEEEPAVDVLMLTGNALPKLKRCLETLAQTQYAPRLRLYLLLNGSGDAVFDYVTQLQRENYPIAIDVLRSPVNVGVPAGLNWLLQRELAPVVVRMDDDLELPPDWLRRMVATLRRFPLAGAVMPLMLVPVGDQRGVVAPSRLHPVMCSSEPRDKMPPMNSLQQTNFMSGALVVYRRKALAAAGAFDLCYSPTQNEDIDHGMAMRAAGYDLLCDGRVQVVHHSTGILHAGYRHVEACRAQRQYFTKKWGLAPAILDSALDRDGRQIEP